MDESYALRSCSKREDDLQRKVISLFYESFDISEIKFWYDGRSKYKYRLEIVRRILFYTPKNIPKLLLIHLTQNFLFYLTAISYILLLHNFFTLNIPKRSISIKLKLNMFHTSQKYYQKLLLIQRNINQAFPNPKITLIQRNINQAFPNLFHLSNDDQIRLNIFPNSRYTREFQLVFSVTMYRYQTTTTLDAPWPQWSARIP